MRWRQLIRFGRAHPADDLRAEIEAHLEMQIEELVAGGWRPDAARDEALRRFGDRRKIERETLAIDRRREARITMTQLAGDLWRDLRQAARQLRRRPTFTFLAVLVTALGIGAASAVFAIVDIALLRPLPFPDGDRMVFLWDVQHGEARTSPSLPEYRDWEKAEFLSASMAVYGNETRLRLDDGWDVLVGAYVTGDPAGVTGLAPLVGRWFTAEELVTGAKVVLLDERVWHERFGGRRDIVGESISLGDGPHTVLGVLPRQAVLMRGARGRGAADVWLPFLTRPFMDRGMHFLRVIGRLRPGLGLRDAQAGAAVLATRLQTANASDHGLVLEPLRDVLVGDIRPTLRLLGGATAFLLLIVCANLAGLFASRFRERAREFGIRVALGAGRPHLLRLVVIESILVGLLGALAGVWLADALIALLAAAAGRIGALSPDPGADARVIGFTFFLSVVVTSAVGAVSAWRATRVNPGITLKEGETHHTGGRRAARRRKLLVGTQIAVSFALLATTGLLVRSLITMLGEPSGFDPDRAVAVSVLLGDERYEKPEAQRAFLEELDRRLQGYPGLVAAGVGTELPLEGSDTNGTIEIVGHPAPPGVEYECKKRIVGPGYFDALGVRVLRGRAFLPTDREGAPDVVIISESLRRTHFAGEDPLGKQVKFLWGPGDVQEVVGVVDDVRHDGLDRPAECIIYRPMAQYPRRGFNLVVRAARDPLPVAEGLRRLLATIDPSAATHDVRTLEHIVAQSTAPRRTLIVLLGGFALLALCLASIGVYGVVSLAAGQRTREIGLRMAIGAQPSDVTRLILGEAVPTVVAGLVAGLGLTLAIGRLVSSMLYGVSTTDPLTLIGVAVVLGGIALLAAYLPARRAARLSPVDALRLV